MPIENVELQAVRKRVETKVDFILASDVYNNLSVQEIALKRLELTEKFLDAEFDKATAKRLPPPPVP
jgi:hypothetical protein